MNHANNDVPTRSGQMVKPATRYSVGQRVRVWTWDDLNGSPARLDKLPSSTVRGIVRKVPTYNHPTYTVDFPDYGELQVQGHELVPFTEGHA